MNKKKSLITALLLVVVAGLSITAGTFAYFQWTTGAEGGTQVNVTIEMGGITMHIEPEQTEFVGLYPTAHCENNVRYGDALVTIVNNTGTLAIPSFKLKVRVTDKDGNGVPVNALEHINYAVVPIETMKDAQGNPLKGDTGSYSCSSLPSGIDLAGFNTGHVFSNAETWSTHLKFESVSTDGSWSHIPNSGDKSYVVWSQETPSEVKNASTVLTNNPAYLPRQYYYYEDGAPASSPSGTTEGITFRGESYSTSYQYYRVYVWIDEGYTTTIVGNTISDPLQNAKIEITWSEESMVQQVSGESTNNEPVLAAGLYDNDGNFVKTWQRLLDDEDIALNGTTISDVSYELNGVLVVDDEITSIGNSAFENSMLSEVRFGSNSQLTIIGWHAFANSSLNKFEVPANVTSISMGAFNGCSLGDNLSYASNSKLQWIEEESLISSGITSIKFPDSIKGIERDSIMYNTNLTTVVLPKGINYIDTSAFTGCTSLTTLTYNGTIAEWGSVDIGNGIFYDAPISNVKCTDGTISLVD